MDIRLLLVGLAVFLVPAAVYENWSTIGPLIGRLILLSAVAAVLIAGAWIAWRRRRGSTLQRPGAPIAASREPIPAGLRFAVLRRDGFRCAYCGRGEGESVQLHLDHLVPVSRGGRTEMENLVTACRDCNLGKSASDLVGS